MKQVLSFDVFQQSVNIIRKISRADSETQKAYYARLQSEYGVKPSRPVLQLIEKSMVGNEDVQIAYQKYCEFVRERTEKRRKKVKEEKAQPQAVQQKQVTISDLSSCAEASELSAKDKKELAMYAIDQHYFFLKQLTGVI